MDWRQCLGMSTCLNHGGEADTPEVMATTPPPPASKPPTPPEVGTYPQVRLSDLKIIGKLGEGGNAVVHQVELLVPVVGISTTDAALKKLKEETSANMEREFEVQARLWDNDTARKYIPEPLALVVNDSGVAGILMELIEGVRLEDYINKVQATLPPDRAMREAIRFACEAARALRAISSFVTHADLSPRNILKRSQPRGGTSIVILDYGSAQAPSTHGGLKLATKRYAAPESSPTKTSDVYSLGVLFKDLFALPMKHLEESRLAEPTIDLLREVFKACLKESPSERPDPHQLVDKLEKIDRMYRFLQGRVIAKRVSSAVAGVAVVLLCVTLIRPSMSGGSEPKQGEPHSAEHFTREKETTSTSIAHERRPDSNHTEPWDRYYDGLLAVTHYLSGIADDLGAALDSLPVAEPAPTLAKTKSLGKKKKVAPVAPPVVPPTKEVTKQYSEMDSIEQMSYCKSLSSGVERTTKKCMDNKGIIKK